MMTKKAKFTAKTEAGDRYRVNLRRGAHTMHVVGPVETVRHMLELWLDAVGDGAPLPTSKKSGKEHDD